MSQTLAQKLVARAAGVSRMTVTAGVDELDAVNTPEDPAAGTRSGALAGWRPSRSQKPANGWTAIGNFGRVNSSCWMRCSTNSKPANQRLPS